MPRRKEKVSTMTMTVNPRNHEDAMAMVEYIQEHNYKVEKLGIYTPSVWTKGDNKIIMTHNYNERA